MRRSSAITIIALGITVAASGAEAKLDLFIDKSLQQMSVLQNGRLLYVWPVSTGQDRLSTPSGVYSPDRLERMWFSRAYYNAPMPHAIFFHHGYAIHGSYNIAQLGGPASHGCVRLHPQDAALLFAMVEQEGPGNTTIVVGGGGAPNPPPRYRDWDDPLRPPYGRDSRLARGPYPPPGPQAPPYYDAPDRDVDGPGPWRGDYGPSAMREPYRAIRPPARRDAQAAVEPALGRRSSYRPLATAPASAKSNSKCATCSPDRASDESPNRHVSASDGARLPPAPSPAAPLPPALSPPPPPSPPTPPPSAEQQQPSSPYKVLPKSYWAGASWRWRLKAEHGNLDGSSATPDSQ